MEKGDLRWDEHLEDLAWLCGQETRRLKGLLAKEIKHEATQLLSAGFFVPATDVLDYAAGVFETLEKRQGAGLWSDNPEPRHSAEFICAFASLVQGLDSQVDMRSFSDWSLFLESKTFKRALVFKERCLYPGGAEEVVRAIAKAYKEAKYNWGINR